MEYLIMIGQLMLSLSILIVLHEMGHFFPARWFGARVEKFYLFFDPYFELFKKKIGDTEYGIGWLPLGGYVKISGMIDESMDKEQMKLPPQPWEFRSKPAWQRLIIMLGGVTVNFVLGFLIYAMVLFTWGEEYLPNTNVEYGIHTDSLGLEMGLQNGDKILSVNGKPMTKFSDRFLLTEIVFNEANKMQLERNGSSMTLPIDEKWISELTSYKNKNERLFTARLPFVVQGVPKEGNSPGRDAGIKVDDKIIAVNGQPTPFYDQFVAVAKENKGKKVVITLARESNNIEVPLTLTETGAIGLYRHNYPYFYKTERQDYTLLESFPAGINKGWNFLSSQFKAYGQMFKGKIKVTESLGGFGSIGTLFGKEWIWERFWELTAALSLILAFMNLLPIPALDGGHVMFLLYEVISGRKPSDRFMETATVVGFVVVIGLVLVANGLDLLRLLGFFK